MTPVTEPDRAELLDRKRFLERSLEDLDRELELGELDPREHGRLRRRDETQLAQIDSDLILLAAAAGAGEPAAADGVAPRRLSAKQRRWIGRSAAVCFAAAAVVLSLALAGVAPFTTSTAQTLSVATRIRTELAEAATLAENHNVVGAVAVYDDVLALDPRQPEALAEGGWLVRLAGLSSHRPSLVSGGDREIAEAVRVAPQLSVPRAYYGVALFEDRHDPVGAVAQFRAMLADHPSAVLVRSVRTVAQEAFRAVGQPLPAELRA